jgi:hypothetical protein
MIGVADVARFRTDDPEPLVLASLACPVCLGTEQVEWALDSDGYDPWVQCVCRHCEERWPVYLTPWQALRLELMAH